MMSRCPPFASMQMSSVFQKVFQKIIGIQYTHKNQRIVYAVQITPANLDTREARPMRISLHLDA